MSAFNFINDDSSGDEFADQSQSSDITFGSIDDIINENNNETLNQDQNKIQNPPQTYSSSQKKGQRVIGRQNSKISKSKDGLSKKKPSAASRFAKKPAQGSLPSFAIAKSQQNQKDNITNNDNTSNINLNNDADNNINNINVINNNVDTFLSATSSDPEYPLPDSTDNLRGQNNSSISKQIEGTYPSSLDKSADDSNSAFSFTNSTPTNSGIPEVNPTDNNSQNELDFDFGTAQQNSDKKPIDNITTGAPSLQTQTKENLPLNPFAQKSKTKQTNNTVDQAPNPFSIKSNSAINTINNENPFSKSTTTSIQPKTSLTPEDKETQYIKELENYEKQAHNFYDNIQKLETSIKQLEKSQADALSNDMCEHAQQIGLSIINSHKKLIDSLNGFSTALECAMNLANDAPKHMDEHSKSSQKNIPQLRVRQSAMMKRMTSLVDLQENDKQTLEVERSKVSTTIRDLNQPLNEHRKKHAEAVKVLEGQIKECERPFRERIDILNEEKASHNKRISELMAEIESHNKAIKGINNKISEEERLMNKELEIFSQQQKEIKNEERSIATEAKTVAQKQRELESPFIDLQETVKKRDEEIAALSSNLDNVAREIHEAEQDVDDSQAASDILLEMCKSHANFKISRSVVKTKFDLANKAAFDAESRLNQINMDIASITLEKDKAGKRIDEAMSQIPQLESSKKAYVASKNFKGAQQVAKLLKEAQDNLAAAKSLVDKSETKLNDLQIEEKEIKTNSFKLAADVDEAKKELDKTDFAFYSKASDLLLALCNSSPFAAKLLASLKDLVSFACKVTEPPKEPTKEELTVKLEELNNQINKAISEENFEAADELQKQIDRITVKIERLKQNDV